MSAAMDLHLAQLTVQRQVCTAAQRRLADLLELPDGELQRYIDELVGNNPALGRVLDVPEERVRALRANRPQVAQNPHQDQDEAPETLFETLLEQLRMQRISEEELLAGVEILGSLDQRGMLDDDISQIAERAETSCDVVEAIRHKIMQLEPPGCGARDVVEYLTFMVRLQWPDDPYFPEIVSRHLEDLKRRRYDRIARAMDQDVEDIEEYHRMLIADVDPAPARGRAVGNIESTRPSMAVAWCETSGMWRVHMDEPAHVAWRLDPEFLTSTQDLPPGEERTRRQEHIRRAREALRQLEERHSLVRQVAELAVTRQRRFFHQGHPHLVPLTMTAVAQVLRRDTSTISRVVAGRYLRWPGGVIALRDLFPTRAGGAATSAQQLHAQLRQLIAAESPRAPRSDAELARLLARVGIPASRRTVQKHRERLGIPASRDRKNR
jgi:RNA polymerase sigma-54 factor